MFTNRQDAGERLAEALIRYEGTRPLVLALPRGGVEVGFYIAKALDADFAVLVARKLPFPDNPEAGFGAIAEDGSIYLNQRVSGWLPAELIDPILQQQRKEAARRVKTYRNNKPLPSIKGRTVILVDDGIAMGSTMRAGIKMLENQEAGKIIVAAPVSSPEVAAELKDEVDEVVILEKPPYFQAVAQAYRYWYDVPDEEVLAFMEKWEKEKETGKV